MAGPFKRLGVDDDELFPPRVETRLAADFVKRVNYTAKGVLLAGTGAAAYSTLSSGTDGQVLTADAASPTGLKWAAASGAVADATVSSKGVVQLSGDLGGTAASPTVPGLTLKASLASPAFTGTPTAPTAAAATNTTQIATTAFVKAQGYAPLASPALTGTPTAPTASLADNSTTLATTAWVKGQGYGSGGGGAPLDSPAFTGVPTAPTAAVNTNTTQLATTAFVMGQGYAPLASPTFTGTVIAPTMTVTDNSTNVATTAFVKGQGYAPLASPSLTGTPVAPTASSSTNTTQLATTAMVQTTRGLLMGINAQTGTAYTLVLSDRGKLVTMSNAAASTLTVPPNSSVAFSTGTEVEVANIGTGPVTLTPGAGVTLLGNIQILPLNASARLVKTATDTWVTKTSETMGLSTYGAKGQLVTGAGANSIALTTVGSNTNVLVADSSQSGGVKWEATTSSATAASLPRRDGNANLSVGNATLAAHAVNLTTADSRYVRFADYSAKGSILVGTAASTETAVAVGTDGQVLTADSTQATGVKWGPANRYVGVNAQTGTTYTPVLTDEGKFVTLTNASPITVTMPQDSDVAIPVGGSIDFQVRGAGMATFVNGTGATVDGTPSLVTRANKSVVTAIKVAANTWTLAGDLA